MLDAEREGDVARSAGDLRLVEARATEWFPDLTPPVSVSTEARAERAQSSLHRMLAASAGDRSGPAAQILVKRTRSRPRVERPRLGLRSGFADKHRMEARALTLLHAVVGEADADGLRAIRVLEVLPDGLVMTVDPGMNLGTMIRTRHGIGCGVAVGRAGALLRLLHRIDSPVPIVRSTACELTDAFAEFVSFLGPDALGSSASLATEVGERLASDIAERPLTVGLGHGDFAPRNVLADSDGAAIIDPLGCQRSPIEEDLAFFAVALRRGALVPWLGPLSERQAQRLESSLIDGYGRSAVDPFRLDAFAVLVLLDAMAADVVRPPRRESLPARQLRRTLPDLRSLLDARCRRAIEHTSAASPQ